MDPIIVQYDYWYDDTHLNLHEEFHVEDSTDDSDIEDNLNPTPASRLGNTLWQWRIRGGGGGGGGGASGGYRGSGGRNPPLRAKHEYHYYATCL